MRNRVFITRTMMLMLTAVALLCVPSYAQTFSVIYKFTGGSLGAMPYAGLTMDVAGNLYGTTLAGGPGSCTANLSSGCGTVYKLTQRNSQWTYSSLYSFAGGADGAGPETRVIIGPNGSLYGTTFAGGEGVCAEIIGLPGCGTVFNLQPPADVCASISCPWHETQLYVFQGTANGARDGVGPHSNPFFLNGNIYGTTEYGGPNMQGTAYELTPENGGWTESIIWPFSGTNGQAQPRGMTADASGNLFGVSLGDPFHGAVWELTNSGSGWSEQTLYTFTNGSDGEFPRAGVILDSAGNLYGSSSTGGKLGGGVVFQLSASGGSWQFNPLANLSGLSSQCGPGRELVMDAAGNIYGTTNCDGAFGQGTVFELVYSNGTYTYNELHPFQGGPSDGAYPLSNLVIDASGNLYGTASEGGSGECLNGCGVIFKITP